MNRNHTVATMVTAIAGSLITAYAPAVQHLAGAHPDITGCVAAALSTLLGVLPSATGTVETP